MKLNKYQFFATTITISVLQFISILCYFISTLPSKEYADNVVFDASRAIFILGIILVLCIAVHVIFHLIILTLCNKIQRKDMSFEANASNLNVRTIILRMVSLGLSLIILFNYVKNFSAFDFFEVSLYITTMLVVISYIEWIIFFVQIHPPIPSRSE